MAQAFRFVLKIALFIPGICLGAETAASLCVGDLEDIAAFLPKNDTGADAAMRHHGAAIDAQLQLARKQAAEVSDGKACDAILSSYLKAWRPGHLSIGPWPWSMASALSRQGKAPGGLDPYLSKIEMLSKNTVLLVFPTFFDSYKADIEQLLKKNRAALESHPNWVVDIRKNNGGSDSTYVPLLPWLMSGGYVSQSVEWLSTADNLHAQEAICSMSGDQASCAKQAEPIVAALRNTPAGHYTMVRGAAAVRYGQPSDLEKNRPRHVAVLIDRDCGSSCEQFLLMVRQSQSVKLVGRPTSGELDVSNLRPHMLPSGSRAVFYATSRSLRLPDMPIDQIGVQPDILLPRPVDVMTRDSEIYRVQHWLEGGSLQ